MVEAQMTRAERNSRIGRRAILGAAGALALAGPKTLEAAEKVMATETVDSVRDEIAENNRQFADALWRKDIDALSAIFTEDVQLFAPNRPMFSGREEILAFWRHAVEDPAVRLKSDLQTMEVVLAGDLAFEAGRSTVTAEMDGREMVVDRGKYIVIWKRDGGRWKMHRDIFNSDLPTKA
jgi:uncharacterized protein (TIGR02246 family)